MLVDYPAAWLSQQVGWLCIEEATFSAIVPHGVHNNPDNLANVLEHIMVCNSKEQKPPQT